jgi:hypothetical protein
MLQFIKKQIFYTTKKTNMKKILIAAILFTSIFASCKKDECPAPVVVPDLGGFSWSGPSTVNGVAYTMSFSTAADGTLTGSFNPGSFTFTGSWNKTPNSNVVRLFFVQAGNNWKGQGTLNTEANKIEAGTLTQTSGGALTGVFTVTKQ